MKRSIILIIILLSVKLNGQIFLFNNNNYSIKLSISCISVDTLEIFFELKNSSNKSFFVPTDNFYHYSWSKSKKRLEINIGMDLKAFTESRFQLQEIKPNNILSKKIKLYKNLPDSLAFKLAGSFIFSETIPGKTEKIFTTDLKERGINDWIWFEYYLPAYWVVRQSLSAK